MEPLSGVVVRLNSEYDGGYERVSIDIGVEVGLKVYLMINIGFKVDIGFNVGFKVDIGVDVGLMINIGFKVDIGFNVGFKVDIGVGVGLMIDIGGDVGLMIDIGGDVGFKVDIGVDIGFTLGFTVDIGLIVDIGFTVDTGVCVGFVITTGFKIIGYVTYVAPFPDLEAKLHSIVTLPELGICNIAVVEVYIWYLETLTQSNIIPFLFLEPWEPWKIAPLFAWNTSCPENGKSEICIIDPGIYVPEFPGNSFELIYILLLEYDEEHVPIFPKLLISVPILGKLLHVIKLE